MCSRPGGRSRSRGSIARELRAWERGEKLGRQERVEAWLVSEARVRAMRELGPHIMNALLEREGDLDRSILALPAERKVGLFVARACRAPKDRRPLRSLI